MNKLVSLYSAEPAVIISAVRAVLVAAVGFGLDLSAEQITSLILALEAVFALLTRQSVYAPATVERIATDALEGVTSLARGRHAKTRPAAMEDVPLPPGDDDEK